MRQGTLPLLFLTLCLPVSMIFSQQQSTVIDTTSLDPGKNGYPAPSDEIVLEEIDIQGRVDKPGVIILPKRVSPDVQGIELDRSFEQEVKKGVGDIPKGDAALRKLEPIKSIKKAVDKKR